MKKPRTLDNLNPWIAARKPNWAQGMLDAAQLVDEMYSGTTTHKYLLGDCILLKCNLITKRQVRVNKRRLKP